SKKGDGDWYIGAVIRSCNINRPDNIVGLTPGMSNFNDLFEIFSLDYSTAHQEKSDDQVIIMNQNGNQQLYLHPIQPAQFIRQISFPPSPTTVVCVPPTTTTPKEWIDLQEQLDIGANIYPNFTFSMKTPLIQTRTRNYYKCSTSKLCEAKKTIEKIPKDENIFLVSYSGEHNHDPPTNRRIASCNSSSKFKLSKGINILPRTATLNASSSSFECGKRSRVVASPIIATMPPLEIRRKTKIIVVARENKCNGKKEMDMNEDILVRFE
ncbi:hypothetical protein H5410_022409, partial [Solanum commersonii]